MNGMISFSLIGLITYLYKSKGHGVSWDWFLRVGFFVSWPFCDGPFEKDNRLINLINYYRN